jgi:endoglucanase
VLPLAVSALALAGAVGAGAPAVAAAQHAREVGSRAAQARHRDPFIGRRLWINPDAEANATSGAQTAQVADSIPAGTAALHYIAATPTAVWLTASDTARQVYVQVRHDRYQASLAKAMTTFVLFALPNQECGPGGLPTAAAYEQWVRSAGLALAGARTAIVVEPDALAQLSCLTPTERASRLALIRFAVRVLAGEHLPVYIDAGNARWIPAVEMAARLREAGVAMARGFSLNVSNYDWTSSEVRYGDVLSRLTGGKHFVIDTSRNGSGPGSGPLAWCNLPTASVGHRPTARTGLRLVDAFLWIKTPGRSDGTCRPGAPPAGTFWPAYAIGLVERAHIR